jgi:Rieske 2Fe-2S family protein
MAATVRLGTSDSRIDALIAQQRPGYALAQEFYGDPELFERDLDRLLMCHWLCAGHASLIPNPGDYFLFELAAESAIIVRGEDGAVRALANVCRHRGSRVCAEKQGHAKFLVCPYHGWSYGLDGALRAARHMPAGFDMSSHGLKPIELRVVQGVIFVNFAAQPLGTTNLEATVNDCFGPYDWAGARIAHRETYQIAANWKLAVENYLECYHCGPSHPEYSKLHALEQPLARIEKLNARMAQQAASLGIDIPPHDHWQGSRSGEEAAFGFRYALYDKVLTGSEDGQPVAPLMGRFGGYDGGVTSVHLGPTSFLISYADHGVIYRFIPKAPEVCAMEVIWLVRSDAKEGADYDRAKLTWLWQVTSEADKRIVEENQLGVNSRFYEPGPYAPMEYNTTRYIDWYLREIA